MADSLRDTVSHAANLVSKESVDYSKGTKAAHCGICEHYQLGHTCNRVAGKIFPGMWCKLFERRK